MTPWEIGKQKILDPFIRPRRGSKRDSIGRAGGADSHLVLFGGPHGINATVGEYGTQSHAHFPYTKKLTYGYNARKVRARPIRLVWHSSDISGSWIDENHVPQLRSSDVGIAAQPLLNSALDDDRTNRG